MPSYFNNEGHENSFIRCYEKIKEKNIFFIVPKANSSKEHKTLNKVINKNAF
jgi:hypothetical protein